MARLTVALQKHAFCRGLFLPAHLQSPKAISSIYPLSRLRCDIRGPKNTFSANKRQNERQIQAILRITRTQAQSSALSETLAANDHYVLRPESKKATGYVPPFSKPLLDSLLVELPPHLLKELRTKVQSRAKAQPGDPSEDTFLFEQVVQLVGDYNRNLLYQLPGETLEEVQKHLSERGRLVYIAESKIEGAGRGGFAKEAIKAGTIITQYINERELLNAPGGGGGSSITAATAEVKDLESSSQVERKYDYYGTEADWPAHAIPHLLNDHRWAPYSVTALGIGAFRCRQSLQTKCWYPAALTTGLD